MSYNSVHFQIKQTMSAPPRIVVRKAQEADYDAVIHITKEFALGADYIYVQYSELINDPDSSYYVCEVDVEVVSYLCYNHIFNKDNNCFPENRLAQNRHEITQT